MSASPANLLMRLDELKKWQETQQKRLLRQRRRSSECANSDYDTIKGLSGFDSTGQNPDETSGATGTEDERRGNNSHEVTDDGVRPTKKRPFLRRGSGLSRFGMNPGDQRRPFNKRVVAKKTGGVTSAHVQQSLKETPQRGAVTPLKAPDCDVKATWLRIGNGQSYCGESEGRCFDGTEDLLRQQLVSQINELATQNASVVCGGGSRSVTDLQNELLVTSAEQGVSSEQSLYEKALEKELLVFEALEQKAMHSSFSSTNSSVVRILSSTPNKRGDREETAPTRPTVDEGEAGGQVKTEPSKKKSVHFEPCAKNAIMKLLESLQERNSTTETARASSPRSSIDSDDFGGEDGVDFKDGECWSDVNACSSEKSSPNDSLSTESSATTTTCEPKATAAVRSPDERQEDASHDALASKLLELDGEIRSFRKENAAVQRARIAVDKERRELNKEKKAFEKYVLEEKIKVEFYLEDEKKKLAKEKMVFERYVKEVGAKTTRKEREEISAYKAELAGVQEAAKLKERRNATSQARLRNQIKALEKENASLKEEAERLLKQNAKLQAAQKFGGKKESDTKMLHAINRNLSKLARDVVTGSEGMCRTGRRKKSTNEVDDKVGLDEEARRKSNSLEDVALTAGGDESKLKTYSSQIGGGVTLGEVKENDKNGANKDADAFRFDGTGRLTTRQTDAECFETASTQARHIDGNKVKVTSPDEPAQARHVDGNNVKLVSPDGNFIVTRYPNGDVKETRLLEGLVRYYYAENRSWHSTFADGTELLEFADGQTEKRTKGGASEVTFPNGVVKLTEADGTESVVYPDGSRLLLHKSGDERVLLLPNGQREIHNDQHKRREYPDGTVKILYPDGIQETRYSNGRIRIKDESGRLLLDSYDEST